MDLYAPFNYIFGTSESVQISAQSIEGTIAISTFNGLSNCLSKLIEKSKGVEKEQRIYYESL